MAQHAFARPCTQCRTLVTFAGGINDETFSAACPCCGSTQSSPNPAGVSSSGPLQAPVLEAASAPAEVAESPADEPTDFAPREAELQEQA